MSLKRINKVRAPASVEWDRPARGMDGVFTLHATHRGQPAVLAPA